MGNKPGVYHRDAQWGIGGGNQGLGILVRWDIMRQGGVPAVSGGGSSEDNEALRSKCLQLCLPPGSLGDQLPGAVVGYKGQHLTWYPHSVVRASKVQSSIKT